MSVSEELVCWEDFWEARRRERVAWVAREESMVVACVFRRALRESTLHVRWDGRVM